MSPGRARWTGILKEVSLRTGLAARRLRRRAFPGVAILCYHAVRTGRETGRVPNAELHVLESELDEQLRVIKGECHPIDLETLLSALRGQLKLPERAVLVTFDDGYRSVLQRAAPLLDAHRIPAAVYLCPGPLETQRWFWFDAVALAEGDDAVEVWKRRDFAAWESKLAAAGRVPAFRRSSAARRASRDLRGRRPRASIPRRRSRGASRLRRRRPPRPARR
ncbi:MAG TPA: polysaccharide deacetylase family protein, partial [Planctomycetia bacterium]|nr:polysaccharide deacetylase family protein [Planctomycetia bacterium]